MDTEYDSTTTMEVDEGSPSKMKDKTEEKSSHENVIQPIIMTPGRSIEWKSLEESTINETCDKENYVPGCPKTENINVDEMKDEIEDGKPSKGILRSSQISNKASEKLCDLKISMKKSGKSKKSKMPNGKVVQKRPMFRLAEVNDIIGKEADDFFMESVEVINQKVAKMNHATRFWLGVKFCRRNELDFQGNVIESKYSISNIARLLDIDRCIIARFAHEIPETETILAAIQKRKYLTLIECNPKNEKAYFETHASNFEDLRPFLN